ncbi:bifunctional zinc-containing alcohol dehydrogenase/quinone oxidoreductase [Klebsiella pneumoniae]|uniref:Bifunctional zinc-containing alcohol dehydrogenase/quinone oxidoreductase n=1 Tax=Klebsiella pneumoniae TaxID=573 RepID=A0A377V4J6_KLEPN|nr:bifunctional zinc-containing alcohol dehydrogenase/quinone oxidoreductase [Klebsiella pneumoniae]
MSTQMMKAVQQHAFGGPEVLSYEDAPMPVLQAGEVLVQVHAVGVNRRTAICAMAINSCRRSGGRGPLSLDPRDRSLRGGGGAGG